MLLVHLSLTNFRNFIRLEMEFPVGATLVVGPNAQGKTSLLEAIDYLVAAESARAAGDRELVNFLALHEPGAFARIVAEVRRADSASHPGGDRPQRLEIRLVADASRPEGETRLQKEILVNGVRRRAGDLAGLWNAVLFQPDDLQVVEGPPAVRRRFLDHTISQADPAYARAQAEYGRVLTQRNALLRQWRERPGDPRQLDAWDAQLIELGVLLTRGRAAALAEVERLAAPIHDALTGGKEQLRLTYQPSGLGGQRDGQMPLPLEGSVDWSAVSAATVAEEMRRALERARREELERGMTLVGPHRDDFHFLADGLDLRPYGSRGQNRTTMISAKLAQGEWLQQRTGEPPVLLLDETLAELDQARRKEVLVRVGAYPQAVLTAADLGLFPSWFLKTANVLELRGGTLRPIPPPD
jgi:DNA replication and repair protein RecF